MLKIDIWPEAKAFLETITTKSRRQVVSKLIAGYAPLRRYRSGDYRIIYFVEGGTLKVPLIDKRNDDKIYKIIERKFRNTQ